MSTIQLEKNDVVLLDDAGKRHILVNLFDLYGNHSAVRMHKLLDDEKNTVDYPFAQSMSMVMSEQTEKNIYRSVCFRIASLLLEKQRDYRGLVLGDGASSWLRVLAELLHVFNPDNSLYRMHQKPAEPIGDIKDCSLAYADILLPRSQFCFVLFDDTAENLPLTAAFWEQVLLSLKPYGAFWVISSRAGFRSSLPEQLGRAAEYFFADGLKLVEYRMSAARWQTVYEDTMDYAADQLAEQVLQGMQVLGECLLVPREQYDALIEEAVHLEQYVLVLYPQLDSLEIKYHLNRMKEAMIGYRLGQRELAEVQEAYRLVFEEWRGMYPEV